MDSATGVWQETHGIVSAKMYDSKTGLHFHKGVADEIWWNTTTPIWKYLKETSGIVTGCYMMPGCENNDLRPKYTEFFKITPIPFHEKIAQVFEWMSNESNPSQLNFLYSVEPDISGHIYGPDSVGLANTLTEIDKGLADMIELFKSAGYYKTLDLIITSDHGMAAVTDYIEMDSLIDNSLYKFPLTRSVGTPVWAKTGISVEDLYVEFKSKLPKYVITYLKEEIPGHYHYRNNDRTAPILLLPPLGSMLVGNISKLARLELGAHGYDNKLSEMHPLFIAKGPSFKAGYSHKLSPQPHIIDIFPLLCHLFNAPIPVFVNGTLEPMKPLLIESYNDWIKELIIILGIMGVTLIGIVAGAYVLLGMRLFNALRRRNYHLFSRRRRYFLSHLLKCQSTRF